MWNKFKTKVKNTWDWIKKKAEGFIVLITGASIVMAAGLGLEWNMGNHPINYPLTANTVLEKAEFSIAAQEKLRLEHNEMGKKFREGKITEEEWNRYLDEDFEMLNKYLGWDISVRSEELGYIDEMTVSSTTGETIQSTEKIVDSHHESFKKSKRWTINLREILK